MAIALEDYPSDTVYVARVTCDAPVSAGAFIELEQALDALRAHVDSGRATFIALIVQVAGAEKGRYFKRRIPVHGSRFNAYAEFSTAFWDAVLADASLRPLLLEFLAKVQDFASYTTRDDGGIWYLSEDDVVLFCQPVMFYLAMHDIAFVPHYTRMLPHWRIEEASTWLEEDIFELLERHGARPETRSMLETYIASEGRQSEYFEELLAG